MTDKILRGGRCGAPSFGSGRTLRSGAFAAFVALAAGVAPADGFDLHRLVAEAPDGGCVRVPAGVYRIDRPVVIPSGKTLRIVADAPGRTVVDAGGRTNAFVFLSTGNNRLEGFVIRNGRGAPCLPNDRTQYAGGVVMRGGVLAHCRIEGCVNEAPSRALGGGVVTWGRVEDTVVSNCAVRVRQATEGPHPLICSGGGMLLYGGQGAARCLVADCAAEAVGARPEAGGFGGGIEVFGDVTVADTTVQNCRASLGGGGLHVNSGGHVRRCRVIGNRVDAKVRLDGCNLGGGVAIGDEASSGSTVEDTHFANNAFSLKPPVRNVPCGGGAIGAGKATDVAVRRCTFEGNCGSKGGAGYFRGARTTVEDCRLKGNLTAYYGRDFAEERKGLVTVRGCTDADGNLLLASPRTFNPATDWMAGKIGIFQHRLYGPAPECFPAMEQVNPKVLAEQLAKVGADFFCITINQCAPSFLCPNDTLEGLCGLKKGSRCFPRDVPMELADALAEKGIRLMLYTTGTPPRGERALVEAIGYTPSPSANCDPKYTRSGAERWAACFREWSLRYGRKVCGWWVDGCYSSLGFDRPEVGADELFARAFRAGNPDAVLAFNCGCEAGLAPYSAHEDYIVGEINEPLLEACSGRWIEGRQWHLLSYLYSPLGMPLPMRYTDSEWIAWLKPVIARGGCVLIDCGGSATGEIPPREFEQIRTVIAAVRGRLDAATSARLAREEAIRSLTDPLEAANVSIDASQRKFFRNEFARKDALPDPALVRKGPNGEEIWSDAIRDALDRFGACYLPERTKKPYWVDRPVVLKSGQSLSMGPAIFPLGAGRTYLKPVPGFAGPVVVNDKPGDRDIYVRQVIVDGAAEAFAFTGVTGLFVREVGIYGATRKAAVDLKGVRNFRIDGVYLDGCTGLEAAVRADDATTRGLIRNVVTKRTTLAVEVQATGREIER